MFKRITAITLAFVGAFALLAPSAQSAPSKADDCLRVAKVDRPLCRMVQGQFPYAYATEGGLNYVVSGRKLVREITHQGLTKVEMRSYLRGEAAAYRQHATGTEAVVLDLRSMKKHGVKVVQVKHVQP
jgi:hypothetical protein